MSYYFKDYRNAIFSLLRLIGFAEQMKDIKTAIKSYEILAWVYENKKEFKNSMK